MSGLNDVEVDLLVLDYLRERQHIKAMVALESECGFSATEYGPQIAFMRNLIFEGAWDDVEVALQPLSCGVLSNYDADKVLFQARRQRFLELLDREEVRPELTDLVSVLKGMENLCSKAEFNSLCYCLTLTHISEHPDLQDWSAHKGRHQCFESIRLDLERAYKEVSRTKISPPNRLELLLQRALETGVPGSNLLRDDDDDVNVAPPTHTARVTTYVPHGTVHASLDLGAGRVTPMSSSSPKRTTETKSPSTKTQGVVSPKSPARKSPSPARSPVKSPARVGTSIAHAAQNDGEGGLLPDVDIVVGENDDNRHGDDVGDDADRHYTETDEMRGVYAADGVTEDDVGDGGGDVVDDPYDEGGDNRENLTNENDDMYDDGANGGSAHAQQDDNDGGDDYGDDNDHGPVEVDLNMDRDDDDNEQEPKPKAVAWVIDFDGEAAPAPAAPPPRVAPRRGLSADAIRRDPLSRATRGGGGGGVDHLSEDRREYVPGDRTGNDGVRRPVSAVVGNEQPGQRPRAGWADNVVVGVPKVRPASASVARTSRNGGLVDRSARAPPSSSTVARGKSPKKPMKKVAPASPPRQEQESTHLDDEESGLTAYLELSPSMYRQASFLEDTQVIRTLAWSPAIDAAYFAYGTSGRSLLLCGVTNAQRLAVVHEEVNHHAGSIYSIAWNSRGSVVATASNDKTIKLLAVDTDGAGFEIGDAATLTGHTGTIRALKYAEGLGPGMLISGGAGDNIVRLWDTSLQRVALEFVGSPDHVQALTLTSDHHCLVTGGRDGGVRMWDARSGRCTATLDGGADEVFAVTVNPSDTVIAAGYGGGQCVLWDIRSTRATRRLSHHTQQCRSVEYSPDGRWLLTTSFDSTVAVIDVATGDGTRVASVLSGHTDRVVQASWHPAMPWVLSCGVDKSIRLWSAQ